VLPSYNMSISVTAKNQPTLRDIDFVMIYAKFGINHTNPKGRQRREHQGRYMTLDLGYKTM